jgi:hypothetical protein
LKRLTVFLFFIATSPAYAAPLAEVPFEAFPGRAAGCLVPTGPAGAVSLLGPYTPRDATTDLITVGSGGTDRVNVGRLSHCASVAEAPGGAAVVAGTVWRQEVRRDRYVIRAAVRDPGGAFGSAVRLGVSDDSPAVAVASTGAAVVAWVRRGDHRLRVIVARRSPGSAFGPPEIVGQWRFRGFPLVELSAGIDSAGRTTLLWGRDLPSLDARVEVATAPSGEPFAIQRLASRVEYLARPVLAVAPDGGAILAHERNGSGPPAVFERAPGEPRFTPVALRGLAAYSDEPAVAIRDGGGAVVAWRSDLTGFEGIEAVSRKGTGKFSSMPAVGVSRSGEYLGPPDLPPSLPELADPFLAPPADHDGARLRAAIADDDRVLLAWSAAVGRQPLYAAAAKSALGRLGGRFEAA